ncbi:MAG: hypothetical protein ACTSXX_04150 [Candidatus Baldrarchaeia archaeon]
MEGRKVWVTFVGESPPAVYNPVWAAFKKGMFTPNVFYLLHTEKTEENAKKVAEVIKRICKEYGDIEEPEIFMELVGEEDFNAIFRRPVEIIKEEVERGAEVAIDITPGRKYMSAALLIAAKIPGVKHAFYLHLKDMSFRDVDYPQIPMKVQEFHDLLKIVEGML